MSSVFPLSIAATIIGFLGIILNGFPLNVSAGVSATEPPPAGIDVAAVEQVGENLFSMYSMIVTDIASFQEDPSLEKARSRRDAFVDYGQTLTGQYRGLVSQLKEDLAQLLPGAAGEQ